ncbi:hypothetical protein EUGRSUZ_H01712 [Eucalyptus grandis]|uniref:Uncharacterized protein n=2 Tax=Eucalyptus grandis TaxID=71139 RepID=A0ACC3JQA6_EUCGR|nr:hypothetical protein EUGRSUZ_H01712 [Eucalyptus grandis]
MHRLTTTSHNQHRSTKSIRLCQFCFLINQQHVARITDLTHAFHQTLGEHLRKKTQRNTALQSKYFFLCTQGLIHQGKK